MVASDNVFAGSIPALYQRLMVPMLFEGYADDLAERVAALVPRDVLETAAGTGAVTRRLAAILPPETRLIVTDLNPAMLALARDAQGDDHRIAWQPADALALPFDAAAFDVVLCQFGVMFFPDKAQGYREARRVLRPGGRFLFNVWDGLATNDFARMVNAAVGGRFPDDPPRFFERTPHGYHDLDVIAAALAGAGFGDVRTEAVDRVSRLGSARAVATAYCQGTPMRAEIEARGGDLEEVTQIVTAALEERFGTGAVEGAIRAFVITATA